MDTNGLLKIIIVILLAPLWLPIAGFLAFASLGCFAGLLNAHDEVSAEIDAAAAADAPVEVTE